MGWAGAIRATVSALSDPALAEDLAAYVIDGRDETVLTRLGSGQSHALGLHSYRDQRDQPIRDLYVHFDETPHDVLIRWGKTLDATSGSGPWRRHLHGLHVDDVYWPGTMLAQVGMVLPEGEIPFDFFDFARLLATAEVHSGRLLVHAWRTGGPSRSQQGRPEKTLSRLGRYGHAVDQLHSNLAPLLVTGDVDHRLHALDMLAPVPDEVLATYAEQLVEAAVSGSTQVRERADVLVARAAGSCAGHLQRVAGKGKPDQRRLALQLLWDTAPDQAQRELAVKTARTDRATSVRALADTFLDEPQGEAVPMPEVAKPAPITWSVEWTDEVAAAVTEIAREGRWWPVRNLTTSFNPPPLADDRVLEQLRELLTSPDPLRTPLFERNYQFSRTTSVPAAIERGALSTEAVVKLLVAGDLLGDDYAGYRDLRRVADLLHEHQGVTLLDLTARLEDALGPDGVTMVARGWFHDAPGALGGQWSREAVWPFFAAHLDAALEYWTQRRTGHSYGFDSERIFAAVATFPETPTRLVDLCFDLALGTTKRDQRAAQDFLEDHPEAQRRAREALSDGNGTVRSEAAGWLGRLGDRDAVPTLATAFARERNDTVKGAMLEALVALGETVESHFDLADADAQAAKVVAKGLPAALKWLDADRLPDVRRSHGAVVPPETMLWLVVGATKAKSSVPTALLKACVAQLRRDDAEAFGDKLLALWIAADEETVGRHAGRHYGFGDKVSSAGQPSGARGLFAVVAACGGARSVSEAARYIRTWHGQRAHQSKALVTMLAHHRHPAAAEALVAIAYRFKAPSIERQAREEVADLAARRDWTQDELADRTVPTAGFDDHGALPLTYGERTFTARLLPDCTIELVDADGKVLKALPGARQGEDEAAKEAKRALSAARKQLKETVKTQTLRLHDAMCVQRSWSGPSWHEDLAGHPVLARLAARLVWVAHEGDARLTFRLLDDGTLTSADDELVELGDGAEVRLAHDVVLTDDEVAAWQQHLDDYEVGSLFAQLGRGRPGLTEAEAAAEKLDARGVTAPAGRLEQMATRLGYRRGSVGDAAAYDGFEKEFASLGLRATMMLRDGHVVGEHDSDATLEGLVVESVATGKSLSLGEVPPVLMTELQHDLATLTALGTTRDTGR